MRAVGLVVALMSVCPAASLAAQLWRPEERVLLSDFRVVTAIAASPSAVYAATPRALVIWDRIARTWRPPVTWLDGYPSTRMRVALADVVTDAVWFGTTEGWARYDPILRVWERGFVAGGVDDLMFDADDMASGVFLRGTGRWLFLPRGGLVPLTGRPLPPPARRVAALSPREALARAPMADAMRALILTDVRLRTHEFTAAATTPDRSDIFFGTSGMGVVRVDGLTGEWESLPYGLPATGAGAIAPGAGGVWVAALARPGEPGGIAWVQADLTRVEAADRGGAVGPPFRQGYRLLGRGRLLWVGTERGVARIEIRSLSTRLFPSDDVRALAPAPDGVWVGTARGLALVPDDDEPVRPTTFGTPVLALTAWRDSLWIGSTAGLGVLGPGDATPAVPPAVAQVPALREPVVALAASADTLVAATRDQVAWRDPDTGVWTLARPLAGLGRITALAGDAGGAWIGGTAGLAFWDIARGTFRTLGTPGDVPAPTRDIVVEPPWLWVATDSGLVRFEHRAARAR